jgi:hypothetical protein
VGVSQNLAAGSARIAEVAILSHGPATGSTREGHDRDSRRNVIQDAVRRYSVFIDDERVGTPSAWATKRHRSMCSWTRSGQTGPPDTCPRRRISETRRIGLLAVTLTVRPRRVD